MDTLLNRVIQLVVLPISLPLWLGVSALLRGTEPVDLESLSLWSAT